MRMRFLPVFDKTPPEKAGGFLSRALAALLVFALPLYAPALAAGGDGPEKPELEAEAAILLDSGSGDVIFEQNADEPLYAGGLAAVMTALLAVEAADRGEASLTDKITAASDCYFDISAAVLAGERTKAIAVGEELSLEDLLCCALLGSSAEACNIIAWHLSGGDIPAFIDEMNSRARELGCSDTVFANTHGLPGGGQHSTARDLALIAREAVKHPELMEICDAVSVEIGATNLSDIRYISSDNYLIRPDYPRYYYSRACGIKSAGTESLGYGLISSASVEGNYVIAVVLGARLAAADGGYYDIQSFVQARKLFDWLFANYEYTEIVSPIKPVAEVPVELGLGADSVAVRPEKGCSMFVPKGLDLEGALSASMDIYSLREGAEPLKAPVRAGAALGEMTVSYGGRTLGPFKLVAVTDVEASKYEALKNAARELLAAPWVGLAFRVLLLAAALYVVLAVRYNIVRARRRRAFEERNESAVTTLPTKKR